MALHSQPLLDIPTVRDYIANFEQIADDVWQQGYLGFQEVCLLLAEALRELPEDDEYAMTELFPIFGEWTKLVEAYKYAPAEVTPEILNILRQPELEILLSEEEFEMIAIQLSEGKSCDDSSTHESSFNDDTTDDNVDAPALENLIIEDYAVIIGQLADQAANDGHYGLQDACLLLGDALSQLQQEGNESITAGLSATLAGWPALVEAYGQDRKSVSAEILNFLRQPALNISLSADEFEMLEAALVDGDDQAPEDFSDTFIASSEFLDPDDEADNKHNDFHRLLPRETQEILDMLLMQTELVGHFLLDLSPTDPASAIDGLQQAEVGLERLGHAAETAGHKGLALICEHVNANIHLLTADRDNLISRQLGLLGECVQLIKEYLSNFSSMDAGQQLVFLLSDEGWALPLSLQDATAIFMQIRDEGANNNGEQEEIVRKQVAEAEDVTLNLPEDVNQELLEILLHELPIQTQQFSEAVQRLQSGGSSEDVQVAQRIAHTLKGSANTVGIKGIAILTHNLEDILTACSAAERIPQGQLAYVLIHAADCLEGMSETLLGLGKPPADAENVLQEILDWANRIDSEGVPVFDELKETDQKITSVEITETDEKAAASSAQASMVRVPSEKLESLFRLSGESIILNSQAYESMRRMKNQLDLMQTQFSLLQQLGNELERLIDLKDLSGRALGATGTGFDLLEMDQYNELHTVSRRMAESAVERPGNQS